MPATRHSRQSFAQPALRQVRTKRRLGPALIGGTVAAVLLIGILVVVTRPEGPPKATGLAEGTSPGVQPAGTAAPAATPVPVTRTRSLRAQMGVFEGSNPGLVSAFEQWVGYDMNYVVDFSGRDTWTDIADPDHVLTQWRGSGHRLVHAVPMLPRTVTDATKLDAMRAGARGQYNQYFTTLGRNLVAAGQADAILRIGWEFNIQSWPWGVPEKNADLYRAFFRQIVKAMRAVPGSKFHINWNVNNAFNPNDGVKYWPGNAYVNSVGVDVYDLNGTLYPYKKNCNAACREQIQSRSWDEVIYGGPRGLFFWTDFAKRHGKPMTLPEWGLWDKADDKSGGADNPFFIRAMHAYITEPANNVAMAAYFNQNSDDGEHDVRKSFPAAGKVFKQLFGAKKAKS